MTLLKTFPTLASGTLSGALEKVRTFEGLTDPESIKAVETS
jgi:hypothetical protein